MLKWKSILLNRIASVGYIEKKINHIVSECNKLAQKKNKT